MIVSSFLLISSSLRIEEGTYGVVYRAQDKRTDEIVALKRLKMEREKEGFPITSLREVSTLLKVRRNRQFNLVSITIDMFFFVFFLICSDRLNMKTS